MAHSNCTGTWDELQDGFLSDVRSVNRLTQRLAEPTRREHRADGEKLRYTPYNCSLQEPMKSTREGNCFRLVSAGVVPSSRTLTRTLWQTANEQLTVEKQPDDHSIIHTESCDDDSESILAHGLIKPSCHTRHHAAS